jgi:hypothetical protein
VDLFLTMVDRDGDDHGRPSRAAALEQEHPNRLLVCLAIEEVEVWMLALHRETLGTPWREIRLERNPKERFAAPFLRDHAPRPDPGTGYGRSFAMREIGQRWRGVLQVCPELAELQRRISIWLDSR